MSTKSMSYDHAAYLARVAMGQAEIGGAASTAYGKFAAFTSMLLYSVQLTVTVVGTSVGSHIIQLIRLVSSNTSTSVLGTTTIGTNSVGITTNVALSTAAEGILVNQGDVMYCLTGTDAVGKLGVSWEARLNPGATVTL